jgi:hypothetical protein
MVVKQDGKRLHNDKYFRPSIAVFHQFPAEIRQELFMVWNWLFRFAADPEKEKYTI